MTLTINHISLLLQCNERNGLTIDQAQKLDQRTLSSACTSTSSRDRTIDYDARLSKFVLTDLGQYFLSHDITRKGKEWSRLSVGVSKVINKRGIRRVRRLV